jgi:hypothetical protein
MEAAINSIQSELEETINNRGEGVLASTDERTHNLCEEFSTEIADTTKDQEEFDHRIHGAQSDIQATQTLPKITWRGLETRLKKSKPELNTNFAGNTAIGVERLKFDRSISWAVFRRQF